MTSATATWPGLTSPATPPADALVAVAARGTRVRYADGSERLCATSGLWNANLGHADPEVAGRVAEAASTLGGMPVFRTSHALVEAASRELLGLVAETEDARYDRVAWTTSGASANEVAVKLARQGHALAGDPRRRLVVALHGSYHGLTFGASAHTGEDLGQRLYGVEQREVRFVAPEDASGLDRLADQLGDRVACVVLEPVLGSGTRVLAPAVLAAVERLQARGALVVADEVATGFGRTGPLLASGAWPLRPDVLLLSKGLTNGAAPGAAILVGRRALAPFLETDATLMHAETGAGHPLTAAATLAVLARFADPTTLTRAQRAGDILVRALRAVAETLPVPTELHGAGLFRSLAWPDADVAGAVARARKRGVTLHPGPSCLQIVPPLIATDSELTEMAEVAGAAIADTLATPVTCREPVMV